MSNKNQSIPNKGTVFNESAFHNQLWELIEPVPERPQFKQLHVIASTFTESRKHFVRFYMTYLTDSLVMTFFQM